MAEPRPSRALAIFVVLVVIAAGIGGIAFLYYEVNHKAPAPPGFVVQNGDNVTVDYTGLFANGPQQGRVFDTSIYSVAINNESWPKSLQYSSRGGSPSDYTPLPVHVGPSAPSGGYSYGGQTFRTVVTGFWQGLIGLPGNQTKYLTIPPSLGYSFVNSSCFITRNLTTIYPVVVPLTPPEFSDIFPKVPVIAGTQFTDPVYGWTDVILTVNSTSVTYENLPSLGMTVNPTGWPVVVTNLTSTTITLTSQLSPAQDGLVLGHASGNGVCGATTFTISQVNLGAGTYVEDFNPEVNGQTLIFIVTVVDIYPA
jgi:FKBP-type peptidyl-prolyl cis-trans isomerase 2